MRVEVVGMIESDGDDARALVAKKLEYIAAQKM